MDTSSPDEPPPYLHFLPKTPSSTSFYEMPREPQLKLLVAANGPREVAYAQTIAVRLSRNNKIAVKVVVDDLTHRLAQEFPTYTNRSLQRTPSANVHDIEVAQKQAFDLVAWADLLVLAPIDADTMAKMMAGITDTLLLEVLRSWDPSKRILLVPGMSTHMWENPVTKRQISKLHRKWHWIRVLPPILWHYFKPPRFGTSTASGSPLSSNSAELSAAALTAALMTPSQQRKRVVEWSGLADLIGIIKNHADLLSLGHDVEVAALNGLTTTTTTATDGNSSRRFGARLPPEIWTMIMNYVGDWELAQALGVFTDIPMPATHGWRRTPRDPNDPQQVFMHELEWTLLTADNTLICEKLSQAPATIHDLSALAIKLIFQFALTDVLTYIEAHCPLVFRNFDGKTVPTKASAYFGRTEILEWWVRSPSFLEKQYDAEAVDGASKNGYVHVLEWWRRSGLPIKYTESSLEQASARGHVRVLEWWREASLAHPELSLKPGRSLICAAQYGRVDVIRWWEESGINAGHQEAVCKVASRWGQVAVLELWRELRGSDKIVFNHQVLVEPTIHSQVAVLNWWKDYAHGQLPGMNDRRAKQVEYRTMDIEEALEDAYGDPTAVRRWWAENGLNLGLGTSEWMKSRYL